MGFHKRLTRLAARVGWSTRCCSQVFWPPASWRWMPSFMAIPPSWFPEISRGTPNGVRFVGKCCWFTWVGDEGGWPPKVGLRKCILCDHVYNINSTLCWPGVCTYVCMFGGWSTVYTTSWCTWSDERSIPTSFWSAHHGLDIQIYMYVYIYIYIYIYHTYNPGSRSGPLRKNRFSPKTIFQVGNVVKQSQSWLRLLFLNSLWLRGIRVSNILNSHIKERTCLQMFLVGIVVLFHPITPLLIGPMSDLSHLEVGENMMMTSIWSSYRDLTRPHLKM